MSVRRAVSEGRSHELRLRYLVMLGDCMAVPRHLVMLGDCMAVLRHLVMLGDCMAVPGVWSCLMTVWRVARARILLVRPPTSWYRDPLVQRHAVKVPSRLPSRQ
jgi:hypothetical protein